MKRLQRYEEFQNNQVQEGIKDYLLGGLAALGTMTSSPKKALGQEKRPIEVQEVKPTPTRENLLGEKLTHAPSDKTISLGEQKYLVTVLLKTNNVNKMFDWTPERHKEMMRKGYTLVWDSTQEVSPKWGIKTKERKPPIEIKSDNDKFFELGGYKLNQSVKDTLKARVERMGSLDSIQIEASTDKTPLTPKLKKDLESKGYKGDNTGLSKARSNSIKEYLVSIGVDGAKIYEINLANQGKEGGYDPTARYVKIKFVVEGNDKINPDEYFIKQEQITYYYQKIFDRKKGKIKKVYKNMGSCESGECPLD